jgi:hypothetical protein
MSNKFYEIIKWNLNCLSSLYLERKEKENYTKNKKLPWGKNYPVVVLGGGVVLKKSR